MTMTQIVLLAEWMSERNYHLDSYTIDSLNDGTLSLYMFEGANFSDEPTDGWENLEGGLKKGVCTIDGTGVVFTVFVEEPIDEA